SQSSENNTKVDKKAPVITFETLEYDYGTIYQGDDGKCEFVFKNTGKNPLVLSNVRPSCGCTVPKWSKEPIKGGDNSSIEVKYNTKRVGSFSKSITVHSNASNTPVVLKIKGKVVAKPEVIKEKAAN
ncbi:MAG: DUF1573 domain-containing protein, partial [Bacteroidales bacterium]